jgi:histidinol-phosphate aminotransferase
MARFDPIASLKPHIHGLPPYAALPDAVSIAARHGIPADQVLQLDGNENPYGPSPKTLEALRGEYAAERYSDATQSRLRGALGAHLGVPTECLVGGAGSDELIDLIFRMWVAPGDRVVTCGPTFGMYAFDAGLNEAEFVDVPRLDDWSVDGPTLLEAARGAKAVFLATPNNPTGNSLQPELIAPLLDSGALIVMDEAYIEFATTESLAGRAVSEPALIVLRTFSKWAGLAGLRIGYAVAQAETIEPMIRAKQPYNIGAASEAAAIASLSDTEELNRRAAILRAECDRLTAALRQQEWLDPFPSEANFVLVRTRGCDGAQVNEMLRQRGIFVRTYDGERLSDCIRISMGTPEQNDRVIAALAEIGNELGTGELGAASG